MCCGGRMKITRRQLKDIVLEACGCGDTQQPEQAYSISDLTPEEAFALGLAMSQSSEIESATVEDAFRPEEVEARELAWAGGDNLDDPLDHAYFETGESNAGPHVRVQHRTMRENRMKITSTQLKQIVQEELSNLSKVGKTIDDLTTIDTSLNREDAEYAYDKLSVRLRGDDNEVLDRKGTIEKLMTDPEGFDDMKQQIMQAMTSGHLAQNRAWNTVKTYWKGKLGLDESRSVTKKITRERLSQIIREELSRINEQDEDLTR